MAESVISDIAAGLISKLASLLLNELTLFWGLRDELLKLKATLSSIEALLLDAEEKSMEYRQVKHWIGILSEAMYDADDLLDEFSTEVLRLQVMVGSKIPKKVRLLFSTSNQFSFGLKMGRKVKAIRGRLDIIATARKFHLEERVLAANGMNWEDRAPADSNPPTVVVGRDREKEAIVELLLSSDSDKENVSVVPIVGMGGLGKTTLAQLVYNDDRVQTHFEMKMWFCVSNDFDVKLMVKKILESAARECVESSEMNPTSLLHETLNERRCLVVLDDLWNEDFIKWLQFEGFVGGRARGSKFVITTRLRMAAEMSQSISIHELGALSRDEAWSLFKKMAFKQGQVVNPSHEAIGREIVEKCNGVPLAIREIGGMLYSKESESEWLLFKNEELSKIDVYKEVILPSLMLSYNRIPSHYKHCFASCSLYPKDHKFRVDELIHLWMAQGYLKLTDPNEHFEDVGFAYLMDLFQFSFFRDVEKDMYGDIVSFKMDDLMHDLAIFVGGDNFSVQHSKMTSINVRTRHISFVIDGNSILQDFPSLLAAKRVRTLLTFVQSKVLIEEDLNTIFRNLRCLRMVDLSYMGISLLPSSICKLKHLRHLNLSYNTDIKKLPDSITNLQNLQVLQLSFCTQLMLLPKNITKLVNLERLDNDMCNALTHMPRGIGRLTRLWKLSTFVIAKDNSVSKHCGGLDELHALDNLRGSLTITNLRYVKSTYECRAANLIAKQHLKSITLRWNEDEDDNDDYGANDETRLEALRQHQRNYGENDRSSRDEELLEGLQPHQNIQRIKITYYMGEKWPSWMPWLTSLVDLRLERCSNCVELPCLGELPLLKYLKMNHLGKLKCVDSKFLGLNPCLETLSIQSCPKLTGFPMSNLSELVELEIRDCEELRILTSRQQSFASLTSLSIAGCSKFTYLRNWLVSNTCFKVCVRRCEWLTFVPDDLGKVICLTSLEIYGCKRLRYFPEQILGKLTQLQNLSIGAFSEELDDFHYLNRIKHLPCLEELEIWGSDFIGREMSSLPNQLQHLTNLKSLKIMGFTTMEALPGWLTNLQSLQYLSLNYCRHLLWSSSTATITQHLPNLTHLNIYCCPILEESKSEWLQSLDTTRIKVEFSHVSKVRVRLGY